MNHSSAQFFTDAQALAIRGDFPLLQHPVDNKPLVYLDNANTTQKPESVIQALSDHYQRTNANIHRSVYVLSERATQRYENARDAVQRFIHAKQREEIVFVRGTTEAINLVATSFGQRYVKAGDEIVISEMEHHSNIVPWQLLCQRTGAVLRVIPVTGSGELDLSNYADLLNKKTRIVAVTHVSNVLGTINPIETMIQLAHEKGIPVLIDGAQALPHFPVDVQQLDCDFYAFSGHKMYGPTGIGVLYGKQGWLEEMPPYHGGGNMIREVTFDQTTYADLPYKFEAGTANIAGVIGLGEAIHYLSRLGMENVANHEAALLQAAQECLNEIPGLQMMAHPAHQAGVLSWILNEIHPHDIGTILSSLGIAIRVGHHCAMPLMNRFGLAATARVSFGVYNTIADLDALVKGLWQVKALFNA